ncbi:MAG: SagB/ThcOx family dehydrogenase [Syntrophaceae bacterium]|nr:SagB/ThcOx family dehydrogenase [Syntrophaceae bacterium]
MKIPGRFVIAAAIIFLLAGTAGAEEKKSIPLIKPQMDSGRLLMHVLKERRSSRSFSKAKLPIRVLSNLLWAANGVNRPATGSRTVPSARNMQEVDVYVALPRGLYIYDGTNHLLSFVSGQDIRALTGTQPYVKDAAVNLVFVSDGRKMEGVASEERDALSSVTAGAMAQNVYLYCASEGLATVVRASIDRPALAAAMGLRPDQKILLAQSVGYPKK